MSAKEFKATFKIDDVIIGYSTNKKVRITGIGETRFLYKALEYQPNKERVASMTATAWKKQ